MIDLKVNKKGFATELILVIVVGFLSLVFFGCWVYGNGLINDTLINTPDLSVSNSTNISYAASQTFSYLNTGLINGLALIGFIILFGYSISVLIVAYYSNQHPIMIAVFLMITIISVIFAIYVSNAYSDLEANSVIGETLTNFSMASFVMSNLPYWIAAVGLIGMVLMLSRVSSGGGGI